MRGIRFLLIVFFLLRYATCVLSADEAQLDFFESRIRPVLVQHCYECHSVAAGMSRGGLLLDSRTGWMTGGDSGPAIVPGRPEASHVWQAISASGEVSEMPPKSRLAAEVVENFRLWILNGAVDPREASEPLARGRVIDLEREREFWAYQPRRVFNVGHSIDGFVQPTVEPAAADRLLRRLSLDLTGLPPTLQERTAFLDAVRQRSMDKATEALVDELLGRVQFGEKWARHWLDVVRYADSNGGDFNLTFEEAWRYRNYVIDAFNDDVPYDRFLREQIAGDLLPWQDEGQRNRQLIATGFLMVGARMLTERDKVKMHLDIADEQLDTIGRAVMGLTIGCARCHDHKFDPISAADYYALAGILHSTRTVDRVLMDNVNVTGWTNTDLLLDEQGRVELAAYESRVRFLKEALTSKERAAEEAERSAGIVVDDVQAELSGPWRKSSLRKNRIGPNYLAGDPGQDSCRIVWKTALPAAGRYQLRVTFGGGDGLAKTAEYVVRHSDGETKVIVDQTRKPAIRGLWQLLGEFDFVDVVEVSLSDRNAGGHVIADAIQLIPVGVAETADAPADLALLAEIAALRKELDGLEKDGPGSRQAMAAMDNQNERMGDLQLRIRGEADNPGPRVPRGFLKVVKYDGPKTATFTAEESGRRQLADWITHPNHPLTARVMVNRIWQQLFGQGIVETSDNFGTRGALPTHPELLDYLAERFVSEGWSMKSIIREIVLSRTYQQSVVPATEDDPNNLRLRGQNRRPLPAETIRDSLLMISGQLDFARRNSVVQQLGMYAIATSGARHVSLSQTGELRQRSIYLPVIRGAVPPSLAVFDFPNPDLVTGRRDMTTVPAQALFLMNSAFVRQLSEALSEDLTESAGTDSEILRQLFQRVLVRDSDAEEIQAGLQWIADVMAEGRTRKEAIALLVQVMFSSAEFRFVD
ncbi:MAG: DUF1553 domain-containing protein [Planctomyces sp.]